MVNSLFTVVYGIKAMSSQDAPNIFTITSNTFVQEPFRYLRYKEVHSSATIC